MSYSDTKTQARPIADIVREKTNDGELIVNFLVDMVLGKIEGATLWHRLEATRQLQKLGLQLPQAVKQTISATADEPKPKPSRASAKSRKCDELADIVKQETGDGKDVIRFLVDVMNGKIEGVKIHHRLAAARELLKLAFVDAPGFHGDDDNDETTPREQPDNRDRRNTKRYNDEDAPFNFKHYTLEEYERDRMGQRARIHIFGGEEAEEVASTISHEYWRDRFAAGERGDYDRSPLENPEEDPYGKGCYGYEALRISYECNDRVRVANKAVAEYHKQKFKDLINEDGSLNALADTSSIDPVTLQYLKRNRHLLADGGPPVGPGFEPARGLERPSTEHDSEDAQDPPIGEGFKPPRDPEKPPTPPHRKIRRIIHLGPPGEDDPPDDDSRRFTDPDEIRVPLKDLLSISAGPP